MIQWWCRALVALVIATTTGFMSLGTEVAATGPSPTKTAVEVNF